MKNIISLRDHLFDTLTRLAEATTEEEVNLEVTKAASIVQVAESIIKSAEVENQFIQITKTTGSGFIDSKEPKQILFNVDKEKNWVAESGDPVQKKQEYDPLK